MKTSLLFLALVLILSSCAQPGISVGRDRSARLVISEGGDARRGRSPYYRPPLTIENAHTLTAEEWNQLRSHFLLPLQQGPWRYVIDGITLDADSEEDREWTLLIALDTGQRVKVENFGAWDEATKSYFRGGYRRALRGLEVARGEEAALDRYLSFWASSKRRVPAAGARN